MLFKADTSPSDRLEIGALGNGIQKPVKTATMVWSGKYLEYGTRT